MSPHAAATLMRLAYAQTESEADEILDDYTTRGATPLERARAKRLWTEMLARSVTRLVAS